MIQIYFDILMNIQFCINEDQENPQKKIDMSFLSDPDSSDDLWVDWISVIRGQHAGHSQQTTDTLRSQNTYLLFCCLHFFLRVVPYQVSQHPEVTFSDLIEIVCACRPIIRTCLAEI